MSNIPRNFFPNMPDEVFEKWLEPIAKEYGWPFQSASDSTKDTKWFYVLGKLDLIFWVNAIWHMDMIDFKTVSLSYGTNLSINSIRQRVVEGLPTFFSSVAGSEERFGAAADFIRATGTIPGAIVVLIRNGQLEIVDGNHRIAALCHIGFPPDYKVPAWATEV